MPIGRAPRVLVPVVIPVSQRFDHTRASRELGWHNRPFLDAFRETLALEAG